MNQKVAGRKGVCQEQTGGDVDYLRDKEDPGGIFAHTTWHPAPDAPLGQISAAAHKLGAAHHNIAPLAGAPAALRLELMRWNFKAFPSE